MDALIKKKKKIERKSVRLLTRIIVFGTTFLKKKKYSVK